MAPITQNDTANLQRLKAALWYTVGKTVDAVALDQDINATPAFIGGLTELVHAKVASAAMDIEAFAKHAGRSTISSKDVGLLARNNDALKDVLNDRAKALRCSSQS